MGKFYRFLKALQPVLAILCSVTLFGLYFGAAEVKAGEPLAYGGQESLGSVYTFAYTAAADGADSVVKGALVGLLLFSAYFLIYAVINLAVNFSRRFAGAAASFRGKKVYVRTLFSASGYPIYLALIACSAAGFAAVKSAGMGKIVPGAGLTGALALVTVCLGLTVISRVAAFIVRRGGGAKGGQVSARPNEEN